MIHLGITKKSGANMAVIEYLEGQQKSGFVGFRVDTTIDGKRYQEYFSLNHFSHNQAKRLANALNDKYRKKAEEKNRYNRIYGKLKKNQIAKGLTAAIIREKKYSKDGMSYTISYLPVFNVCRGVGDTKTFRISFEGYQQAFMNAVYCFCDYHGYTYNDRQYLLSKIPPASLFTDYFFKEKRKKYKDVNLSDLREKLGLFQPLDL